MGSHLAKTFVTLLLATGLHAQCTALTGTGCPSAPALSCLTQPRIGMQLQLSSAICLGTTYRLWVLGLPLATPIALSAPIICGTQACNLGASPLLVQSLPGSAIQIPNDAGLIGGSVALQESCVQLNNSCLSLMGAAKVSFLP